ncbi:hypothetical protein [Lyngbya sp. CCY1209]|uniref:hypothetical protein n=1 Tax=Lyngbya sp. CCY1209 TaxID=2886103 RepID=UPI002D2147C6|nr:hypothetical protein [Lyngbya sp. CCY1209]MEB3882667.1 hypothetical protein [Lyngbya sp. CCY1209]
MAGHPRRGTESKAPRDAIASRRMPKRKTGSLSALLQTAKNGDRTPGTTGHHGPFWRSLLRSPSPI